MIVSVPLPHGEGSVQMASFRTLSVAAVLRLAQASELEPLQQFPVYASIMRDAMVDLRDWPLLEALPVDDFVQVLMNWGTASEAAA